MKRLTFLLLTILFGACAPLVPATTPPQLDHTPGAYVVVTDSLFDAGDFVVEYPHDWRVVKTSIASAEHLQVVFVAPDQSTITLTVVDAAGQNSTTERYATLAETLIIQGIAVASADADPDFMLIFEQMMDSLR